MTIEEWFISKLISEQEYYFLLSSLIESIDKVANTASIY
jgi:adenine-specific DNA-methyltransferase